MDTFGHYFYQTAWNYLALCKSPLLGMSNAISILQQRKMSRAREHIWSAGGCILTPSIFCLHKQQHSKDTSVLTFLSFRSFQADSLLYIPNPYFSPTFHVHFNCQGNLEWVICLLFLATFLWASKLCILYIKGSKRQKCLPKCFLLLDLWFVVKFYSLKSIKLEKKGVDTEGVDIGLKSSLSMGS